VQPLTVQEMRFITKVSKIYPYAVLVQLTGFALIRPTPILTQSSVNTFWRYIQKLQLFIYRLRRELVHSLTLKSGELKCWEFCVFGVICAR
jgi:hypothetical protein